MTDGVNKLIDNPYFTRKTDEYLGADIISAIDRSF